MAFKIEDTFPNEKRPDTGFLKAKYVKKRSEIESPYGSDLDEQNKDVAKRSSRNTSKDRDSLPASKETEFVRKYGHTTFSYINLLRVQSQDGKFTFSHAGLADILVVEKNSVRRIISDLIKKKLLSLERKSNPRTQTPAEYRLTLD